MSQTPPSDRQHNNENISFMSISSDVEPYWTVEEVAKILRCKPGTIRKMAKRGELPAIKPNKRWLFKKEDINLYLLKT